MKVTKIIQKTEQFVQDEIKNADGAHDWWHIDRVRNNASRLAKEESADTLVVELGSLLHDVIDIKVTGGDEAEQLKKINTLLNTFPLTENQKQNITESIQNQSFHTQFQIKKNSLSREKLSKTPTDSMP
jgi:uncharacterized protein